MTDTKNSNSLLIIISAIALALLLGGGYMFYKNNHVAETAQASADAKSAADKAVAAAGMSASDRAATEAVVRAYILEHPEIITEAVEILQQREQSKRLGSAGSALTTPFPGAIAGNPAGTVTVVEFTDYNCGYCRQSVADVQKLIASEKDVRIVYRELPILAPSSRDAARWALAAAKQGKHKEFHDAMFAAGPANANSIRAAAQKAGLDLARAETDAKSPEVAAEIDGNLAMMQQIGFNGTPTFVVGGHILEGALGYEALSAAVAKARKQGKDG